MALEYCRTIESLTTSNWVARSHTFSYITAFSYMSRNRYLLANPVVGSYQGAHTIANRSHTYVEVHDVSWPQPTLHNA